MPRRSRRPERPPAEPPDPALDAWRRLVATRDPVEVYYDVISRALELRVLPAFPEPGADYQLYARGLTWGLVDQALAKLARRFPANAKRGVTALIRARKKRAFQVCVEAIEQVTADYANDHREHPDDRLATRVSRLYVAIETSSLESWQGKPADRVGEMGEYALLFADENWMAAVAGRFPEREWAEGQPTWRKDRLTQAQAAGQLPWAVPTDVLRWASEARTREEAVLRILSRTAPLARQCSPASLKQRLKRARRWLAARVPPNDTPDSPPDAR
jgi:hypothetical protein